LQSAERLVQVAVAQALGTPRSPGGPQRPGYLRASWRSRALAIRQDT